MRLTVLGGSAAGPNTGAGCSGYLVTDGDTSVVLDLGPGTVPELRRHVDFRALHGIVVTHWHLDHVLDLATLRFALAYNPVRADRPIPVWLPPGAGHRLEQLGAAFAEPGTGSFFAAYLQVNKYDPTAGLTIGGLHLSFARTAHPVPCWAIRVDGAGDHRLAYTADTGPAADLDTFAAGVKVLVAEATSREDPAGPAHERGHLTPSDAGALAARANAGTLVLTHWWEEHDAASMVRAAAAKFAGRIEVARPGLTLDW
jgi:ribonuclease BN (tRNA processing enzyme)